jgi:hypothetical protein
VEEASETELKIRRYNLVKNKNVKVVIMVIAPLLICGALSVQDKELRERFFQLSTILITGYLALEIPSTKESNVRQTYTHISKVRPEEALHEPEESRRTK